MVDDNYDLPFVPDGAIARIDPGETGQILKWCWDWQPIETAPLNTEVLICKDGIEIFIGEVVHDEAENKLWIHTDSCWWRIANHDFVWMPLPKPPEQT